MIAIYIMDTMDITPQNRLRRVVIKRVSILFDTLAVRGMDVICQYHFIFAIRYVRGRAYLCIKGWSREGISIATPTVTEYGEYVK